MKSVNHLVAMSDIAEKMFSNWLLSPNWLSSANIYFLIWYYLWFDNKDKVDMVDMVDKVDMVDMIDIMDKVDTVDKLEIGNIKDRMFTTPLPQYVPLSPSWICHMGSKPLRERDWLDFWMCSALKC